MQGFLDDRVAMRRTAAGLCGLIAAVYLAIAAGLSSIEPTEDMSLVTFGIGAASIYVVGALLLLAVDHRLVWLAGAAVQVLVAVMYVLVSSDRDPPFEAWGIGLRLLQLPLLVLLVVLALRPKRPTGAGSEQETAAPAS